MEASFSLYAMAVAAFTATNAGKLAHDNAAVEVNFAMNLSVEGIVVETGVLPVNQARTQDWKRRRSVRLHSIQD